MVHEYTRERLEGWVSDFCQGDGLGSYPSSVAEVAHDVLLGWLVAACERRDVEPEDLSQDDLRAALFEHVARLDLPESVHARLPDLGRDLLTELEQSGRVEGGRSMGFYIAATRPDYERAASGRVEPITRPGAKLGRNDPCPCGSGKKFKRCCMQR